MGIRGTVRRSVDGDFIHSNIDIDLLIDEGLFIKIIFISIVTIRNRFVNTRWSYPKYT